MSQFSLKVASSTQSALADSLQFSRFFSDVVTSVVHVNFMTLAHLLFLWLLVAWILVLVWVYKDASLRYRGYLFPLFWTIVVFPFNILGLIAYVILRPADYLLNIDQVQLDVLSSEAYLSEYIICPNCNKIHRRQKALVYCTICGELLKERCQACDKPVWRDYAFCSFCGTAISQGANDSAETDLEGVAEDESRRGVKDTLKASQSTNNMLTTRLFLFVHNFGRMIRAFGGGVILRFRSMLVGGARLVVTIITAPVRWFSARQLRSRSSPKSTKKSVASQKRIAKKKAGIKSNKQNSSRKTDKRIKKKKR